MSLRTRRPATYLAWMLLICMGVSGLIGIQPALAQDPGEAQPVGPNSNSFGFTVRPYAEQGSIPRDFFDYQLPAGQTLVDQVTVSNLTAEEKSFYLYPADAYNTATGGFALRQQGEPAVDAAPWLSLPVATYTIPARSAALVPVTLTVPADATPGDHAAGIVAEEIVEPTTVAETGGLQPIHRVAARVYIRVAGPISSQLQVSEISVSHDDPLLPYVAGNSRTSVTYTITNRGNVRVGIDSITVRISALFGYTVKSITQTQDSEGGLPRELLPGGQVVLTQPMGSVPALGLLTATVSVAGTDPVQQEAVTTSASVRFWIIPWLLLAIIAILVGFLIWRRRRRHRIANEGPGPLPGADSELTSAGAGRAPASGNEP